MKVNFYDVVDVISGGTPRTDVGDFWNGEIPWLSVVDFAKSVKYVYDTEKHITELGLKNSNTKLLNIDDIIISARGTVGAIAMLKIPMAFNQSCFGLRAKREFMNQDYLFYFLKYYMENLKKKTQGSVFSTINLETFRMIDFELPDTNTQIKISKILSCLDSKIENNNKINAELESMAKTLYDYWFLQFEFPNEEGKPYKSSGGKMVWNEELKREIPEGWNLNHAYEIADIKTGKEDANHSTENGKYPFFTCSNDILRCDDHKFEGNVILIAGNGDFNVKHYNGKFNAYQRTYVIKPYDEKYIGLFHICCQQTVEQFKKGSNGSIVKFITLSDIQNIKMLNCKNDNLLITFNKSLEQIDRLKKENEELSSLRNFLLPLLMNGQVTFKEQKYE